MENKLSHSIKVNKVTAREQIYHSLKELIIRGELAPGEALTENELANRFGVSRTPLREALNLLFADGFVENANGRLVVTHLSLENIKELYAVRSRLEGLMAAAAAKRISEGSLSKLWRIIESLKAQNVTIERFNDLSREFHRIIHISAGNSVCLKLLINISNQIERYRFLSLRLPHRIKPSTDEHERILRYLEKGDYFNAEESMKLHLLNARRLIIENFKL